MVVEAQDNLGVGHTPLYKLHTPADYAAVYVKLDYKNPTGSTKDRVAVEIIRQALNHDLLQANGTLVEASKKDFGLSLTVFAKKMGCHAVIVMPEDAQAQKAVIEAHGGQVVTTSANLGMEGARKKAQLLADEKGWFMPNQYYNPANSDAHEKGTGPEIIAALAGKRIDAFVAGINTGGTLSGVGHALKEEWVGTQVVALSNHHTPFLQQEKSQPYSLESLGNGFVPDILDRDIYDEVLQLDLAAAQKLGSEVARREGIVVKAKAAENIWAAYQVARRLGPGKIVVTIAP